MFSPLSNWSEDVQNFFDGLENNNSQIASPILAQPPIASIPIVIDESFAIVLEKNLYLFRHAKEIQNGCHGGYLQGYIALPSNIEDKTITLELSIVPCNQELYFHPNLLHLTHFGPKNVSYKTPLRSPDDWRLVFEIENGKKVYHLPNYGCPLSKIQLPDDSLKSVDDQLRLILGNNKVLISIISTLQRPIKKSGDESDDSGITNLDVIKCHFKDEIWQYPHLAGREHDMALELNKKYSKREFRVEQKRCHLKATIYQTNPKESLGSVLSEIINNARDKTIGPLDLHSISDPGSCCTNGGWKFVLVSKHKLPTFKNAKSKEGQNLGHSVIPVFVITDKFSNPVNDPWIVLNEIPTDTNNFEVLGDILRITIPSQDPIVMKQIKNQGFQIKIALFRKLDEKLSQSLVSFEYWDHEQFDGACPFCSIATGSFQQTEQRLMVNGSRKRAKVIERDSGNFSQYQTPLHSSASSSSLSSSVSSSDGYSFGVKEQPHSNFSSNVLSFLSAASNSTPETHYDMDFNEMFDPMQSDYNVYSTLRAPEVQENKESGIIRADLYERDHQTTFSPSNVCWDTQIDGNLLLNFGSYSSGTNSPQVTCTDIESDAASETKNLESEMRKLAMNKNESQSKTSNGKRRIEKSETFENKLRETETGGEINEKHKGEENEEFDWILGSEGTNGRNLTSLSDNPNLETNWKENDDDDDDDGIKAAQKLIQRMDNIQQHEFEKKSKKSEEMTDLDEKIPKMDHEKNGVQQQRARNEGEDLQQLNKSNNFSMKDTLLTCLSILFVTFVLYL